MKRGWGNQIVAAMQARGDVRAPAPPKRRPVKRARPAVVTIEPANLPWRFAVNGSPATKGNSRSGRGTLPSAAYRAWYHAAIAQVPRIRAEGIAGTSTEPVIVSAVFYRARAVRADLDNYFKGLGDFLQRAGLLLNDSAIAGWDGSRIAVDRERPRVEVLITAATQGAT